MDPSRTAILLIGFQNDYFASNGVLRSAIDGADAVGDCLRNTVSLLEAVAQLPVTIVSTPIIFTPNYEELVDPVGILKTIRDVGAFRAGSPGADTVREFGRFAERVIDIPGKRGLNAFAETGLDGFLRGRGIADVVLAGAVTSLCIDSTGRSAHERGFRVTVLRDCTCGRTRFEQDFYCEQIFPIYGTVADAASVADALLRSDR